MPDASQWTAGKAQQVAKGHYGFEARVRELPSYDDRNFLLTTQDRRRFVLKIALRDTGSQRDDFIREVMARLAGLPFPKLVPALAGDPSVELEAGVRARPITHLPGTGGQVVFPPG